MSNKIKLLFFVLASLFLKSYAQENNITNFAFAQELSNKYNSKFTNSEDLLIALENLKQTASNRDIKLALANLNIAGNSQQAKQIKLGLEFYLTYLLANV